MWIPARFGRLRYQKTGECQTCPKTLEPLKGHWSASNLCSPPASGFAMAKMAKWCPGCREEVVGDIRWKGYLLNFAYLTSLQLSLQLSPKIPHGYLDIHYIQTMPTFQAVVPRCSRRDLLVTRMARKVDASWLLECWNVSGWQNLILPQKMEGVFTVHFFSRVWQSHLACLCCKWRHPMTRLPKLAMEKNGERTATREAPCMNVFLKTFTPKILKEYLNTVFYFKWFPFSLVMYIKHQTYFQIQRGCPQKQVVVG